MKPIKSQKRKITEVVNKKDKCVKKPARCAGKAYQKSTETVKISELEHRIPSAKIKLQLFPISESTRLGLEKDGHYPFLELTLSGGKKISSVVKHLNTKWGSSSVATGQLMLFPFDTKLQQLASSTRWTLNDSAITAREVYAAVGSPPLFRLRYCWCSKTQLETLGILPKPRPLESRVHPLGNSIDVQNLQGKHPDATREKIQMEFDVNNAFHSDLSKPDALHAPSDLADEKVEYGLPSQTTLPLDDLTNLSIGGLLREISKQGKSKEFDLNTDVSKPNWQEIGQISDISMGCLLSESSLLWKNNNSNNNESMNKSVLHPIMLPSSDISIGGLFSEASLLSNIKSKPDAQLVSPWDDGFTSLSIGGLFYEASLQAKAELVGNKSRVLPSAPLSNSFGAFFASELNTHSQVPKQTYHEQGFSLLDAEETCHAFPSRKFPPSSTDAIATSSGANSRLIMLANAVEVQCSCGADRWLYLRKTFNIEIGLSPARGYVMLILDLKLLLVVVNMKLDFLMMYHRLSMSSVCLLLLQLC